MDKHNYYYNPETKQALRYYAIINGEYVKDKAEYDAYIKEHNLPAISTYLFRLSKYALTNQKYLLGKWIKYDNFCPNSIILDNRDFSRYVFENKEQMKTFLNYYDAQDFHYCQQCFYDGYEGDEVDSITYRANKIIETFGEHIFNPEKENKKFAHFIISYLPENEDGRNIRLDAHHKQILDIKETTPNARIYILAQGYKDTDYLDDPQVTYLGKYAEPIGAQKARNELLQYFYNSDYEYGIFSDDDAFIIPTATVKNFYEELEEDTQKFIDAHLDIVYSRNMQYSPFNEGDVRAIDTHSDNYFFGYARSSWLCWVLFRNFKKAYGQEYYQDENIDPKLHQGYDDTDFCYKLHQSGLWSMSNPLFQLLLLNSEENNSTLFMGKNDDPLYRVENINATAEKWIGRDENGYVDYNKFRKQNPAPDYLLIPRKNKIDAGEEITGGTTDAIKETIAVEKAIKNETTKYYL